MSRGERPFAPFSCLVILEDRRRRAEESGVGDMSSSRRILQPLEAFKNGLFG